jgi:FkbM family methyltransferase
LLCGLSLFLPPLKLVIPITPEFASVARFENIMPNPANQSSDEQNSVLITANVPPLGEFGFYVHRQPDIYISGDLLRTGIWEPFETKVFCRLCEQGDFVVDIGANIGWYSIIASRLVGATGKVVSFEPDPTNLQLLEKNVALTINAEQVEIHNLALADRKSSQELFLCADNLGDHRLFDDGTDRDVVVVGVGTLDLFFSDGPRRPTLVKSDTQGSEARILRGARKLFAEAWRPVLILEFWPYGLTNSGDEPLQFFQQLLSLGYDMYEVSEGNPKLVRLTEDGVRKRLESNLQVETMGHTNLLCLPSGSNRFASISDMICEDI